MGKRFNIRDGIRDTYFIWLRELKDTFRDQGVIILFFVVPLFYPLLYTYFYNNEIAVKSKLVVVDMDHTDLSRKFIRMVNATQGVDVVSVTVNANEAAEMLKRKEAYAIARIPNGFRKSIYEGKQTEVTLYSDLSSILYYKNFMLVLNDVSLKMGREFVKNHETDATGEQAEILIRPLPNKDIAYFNAASGYASFLMPVVLILIIQQTMIMGVGMLAGTNRERNRNHLLISVASDVRGPLRIVFGKSIAYIMIYAIVCVWILLAVPAIFDLPRLANPLTLALFILPYLLACTFFSLFISCFIRNREESMLLVAFSSLPFLFLTGIPWPTEAMPQFWQYFSQLIPSTFGARGFVALNSMGASMSIIANYHFMLWLQAGFYFILSALGYAYQFKLRAKKIHIEEAK
ncbi:ABC transporter permease [Falsiporphyromonas endometrii]|uniref:ABC transporter permease n=1 Tax=Falsiporphyromonas endometrii TaxID=1387297 RepID=A0ABV9K971_9PORP|nr:ABC transporter permease [Porphyromonadaceae bacterium]